MGEPMQLKTLYALLIDELRGLYIAESLIQEAGVRLQKGAHADPLKDALGTLQAGTGKHMQRLEEIFSKLGENPRGGAAEAVKAILESGEERLGTGGDPRVVDAGMILVARRLLSWQVASYGTLGALCPARRPGRRRQSAGAFARRGKVRVRPLGRACGRDGTERQPRGLMAPGKPFASFLIREKARQRGWNESSERALQGESACTW